MRYYNKTTKNEAIVGFHTIGADCIGLADDHIFWSPIPEGKQLDYDGDALPILIDEVIDTVAAAKEILRRDLDIALDNLTVTIAGGKDFEINHETQYKYQTAIKHLDALETIGWTLADGTYDTTVTKEELEEALELGEIQGMTLEGDYHAAKALL